MTDEQVYAGVEKALRKYFGKRGDRVVQDNLNCVKRGYSEMKEIPVEVMQCLITWRGPARRNPALHRIAGRDLIREHNITLEERSMLQTTFQTLDERSRTTRTRSTTTATARWSTRGYKLVSLPVLDVIDFNERIIRGYEEGYGEKELPADLSLARSLVPAGTATLRDFSNIAPEIPEYIAENCTGCMDCVTECPDTAILGKVLSETELEEKLKTIPEGRSRRCSASSGRKTKKYYDAGKKKGGAGGMFNIIIDPSQVQGLRRVRHRLRRRRPEDDRQDRRGHDSSRARAIATSRTSARATTSTSATTC